MFNLDFDIRSDKKQEQKLEVESKENNQTATALQGQKIILGDDQNVSRSKGGFKLEFSDSENDMKPEKKLSPKLMDDRPWKNKQAIVKKEESIHGGRPITSDTRKNKRRRERYLENKCVTRATNSDWRDPKCQKVIEAVSELKAGKGLLQGFQTIFSSEYIRHVKQLHENSRSFLQTSNFNYEKCQARHILTQNLTPKNIAVMTGLSERSGRRIAAFNRQKAAEHNSFKHAIAVVKSTRIHPKICDFEVLIYKEWFLSNTDVRSGSSTELRQVSNSKHEFLYGLFACFPSLLRSASKTLQGKAALEQAMQSQTKTRFQIALISSQEVQDDEYSVRYEFIKHRYREHLKKKQAPNIVSKCPKTSFTRLTKKAEVFNNSVLILENNTRQPLQKIIKEIQQALKKLKLADDCSKKVKLEQELVEKRKELHQVNCEIQKLVIEPIGDSCFWDLIENRLKISWTGNVKPYNCQQCEKGPAYHQEVQNLSSEVKKLDDEMILVKEDEKKIISQQRNVSSSVSNENYMHFKTILEDLKVRSHNIANKRNIVAATLRKTIAKERKYQIHQKQLETCRECVINASTDLKIGECLVYRDFVNQHNEEGKKINNFVLVVLYREVEGGPLLPHNISNIIEFANDGSCDSYFVADAFIFHLKKKEQGGSGLFEPFQTIIISGDHGPHFSSAETVYHESTFYERFDKKIRVLSLCSYHAFNRCDAAGAAVKSLAQKHSQQNLALISSSDYVFAVREDGQQNAWSYEFSTVNRSNDVFDGNGTTEYIAVYHGEKLRLSDMCQLEYCFVDESGKEAYQKGIVLARPVIGQPVSNTQEFFVIDVSKDSKERGFCTNCSNLNQRPMYHGKDQKCTVQGKELHLSEGLFSRMNLYALPDPTRLHGTQLNKSQHARSNLKMGRFPCRFENCNFKSYNHKNQANAHMMGKHHEHETSDTRNEKLYTDEDARQIVAANPLEKKPKKRKVDEIVVNTKPEERTSAGTIVEEERELMDVKDESDKVHHEKLHTWSDRDNAVHSVLKSVNPKKKQKSYIKLKSKTNDLNKSVWRIREYCKAGPTATIDESKVYADLMVRVYQGVVIEGQDIERIGVEEDEDLVRYAQCTHENGMVEMEEVVPECRKYLFDSELEAKLHLLKILQKVNSELRETIVTEAVWTDLNRVALEQTEKSKTVNDYELQNQKNIQENEEVMKKLGLIVPKDESKKKKVKVKQSHSSPVQIVRRSTRFISNEESNNDKSVS